MHHVIIGVVVPALLILLYGVAARAQSRRELATASRILEYHVVIKAFGWLLFACTWRHAAATTVLPFATWRARR